MAEIKNYPRYKYPQHRKFGGKVYTLKGVFTDEYDARDKGRSLHYYSVFRVVPLGSHKRGPYGLYICET